MNPLKTERRYRSDKRRAKYPHPDEALMAPIDTKARIKRQWLFHLRAEISFVHLDTCRRRWSDEGVRIERVLTRMLKRKCFIVAFND